MNKEEDKRLVLERCGKKRRCNLFIWIITEEGSNSSKEQSVPSRDWKTLTVKRLSI